MDVTPTLVPGPELPVSLRRTTYQVGVVCSPVSPMVELRRTCLRLAATQATVLLSGETGTGKEVFARLIHAHSPRAQHSFVAVNCSAIPEALLESELFGYVKGAFTGATQPRRGRVALAEGGTLLLDEIGELPLGLQVKLLRLLQERTYEPVGSSEPLTADFRLVAATNRNLVEEVRLGRFRKDLYYRLNVCPIQLPPLRERPGDISQLFHHFWQARGERRPVDPAAMERLQQYEWPGNVRELENLVERLSVIAEADVIRVEDLPPPLGDPLEPAPPPPMEARSEGPPRPPLILPLDLPTYLRDLEKAYIDEALSQTRGNKKEAARLLGMGRTTLVEKLRRRAASTPPA
jgi:sigma-54 dependent transcriptional regulator, flagellar regulatory protein